jgi:Leucine-rich repeat (LRR) protein
MQLPKVQPLHSLEDGLLGVLCPVRQREHNGNTIAERRVDWQSSPSSVGSLSKLKFLGLGSNVLVSKPPSTLGLLKELFYLDLAANELTGTIPSEIAALSKLENLYLRLNRLTGLIPPLLFGQYDGDCALSQHDSKCDPLLDPRCNSFSCPLPPHAQDCHSNGDRTNFSGICCEGVGSPRLCLNSSSRRALAREDDSEL